MNSPPPAIGTLYLIPVPVAAGPLAEVLPDATVMRLQALTHFVVENARTARATLKAAAHPGPLQDIRLEELNEHTPAERVSAFLAPLLSGQDVGLMSEAGCPGVADPGALLVAAAHAQGIPVRPLVGPSSILLSLMASGLTGQRFAFLGYLPPRDPERSDAIRAAERRSTANRETQIFIETPYRNVAMMDALLAECANTTRLTIAAALTAPDEFIRTQSIAAWRALPPPERERHLHRRPAVFLLESSASSVSAAPATSRSSDSRPRRRRPRSAG